MNDFRQVLCPLDFSEPSLHAATFAARLAARLELPMVLIHVLAPMPVYSSSPETMLAFPVPMTPDDTTREGYAMARLKGLQGHLSEGGVEVTIEVLEGPPGKTLVERIGQSPDSLVIVGTHGYKGIQRFVLGSTTVEMLRRSPSPILTVREHHAGLMFKRIGVAVDFSASCERAIEAAAKLARIFGSELHLVHILPPIEMPNSPETHIPLYVSQVGEASQQAAQRELDDIGSRLTGIEVHTTVLVSPTPYHQLAQYAQDARLDLVAMGTHGRTGLRRLFLGSTAERLMQISPCPVLSVRLPDNVPAELSWREVAEDLKLATD